jgi:uncharacterized protein
MKNITRIIVLSLLTFCFFSTKAQLINKVEVLAKVAQDGSKIMLRWAPSTPALWKMSNKQTTGYTLKKYRVFANSQLLTTPVLVSTTVIKVPDFTYEPTPLRLAWFSKFIKNTVVNNPSSYFLNTNGVNDPTLIINDEYAILWGAYYADTYAPPANAPSSGIIDESSELEKRFNSALSIVEGNFQAAEFVGLGYTDNAIIQGEKYLYEVSSNVPVNAILPSPIKGSVYIGTNDKEDLTVIPPYEINVAFKDSTANINWNTSMLSNFYSSYDIYKSSDNITYKKLNSQPLVNISGDKEKYISYTDFIAVDKTLFLNQTYFYKVIGKTPFGEFGKESDVVSGKPRLFLKNPPYISDLKFDVARDSSQVILSWTVDKAYVPVIQGFLISYSETSSTTGYTYLPITVPSVANVDKYSKSITGFDITKITYFRVTSVALHGDNQDSNAEFIEPIDSIAPLAPTIISVIETSRFLKNGDSVIVAQINWQSDLTKPQNTDIAGYRVFRAQNEKEEASQITNLEDIVGFTYSDTISFYSTASKVDSVSGDIIIKRGTYNLNPKVYYRVKAIDKRENQGPLSLKKFLPRPDRIGLPAVTINDYNMGDDGIGISWSPYVGTDSLYVNFDFKDIKLFRTELTPTQVSTVTHTTAGVQWLLIGEIFDPVDSSYFDINVEKGKYYAYCAVTSDLSDNKSYSAPFVIEYKPNSNSNSVEPLITNLLAVHAVDTKYVKLTWQHTSLKVIDYVIYRAKADEEFLTNYKILNKTDFELFDLDVKTGDIIRYGIIANYEDGSHSTILKTTITY